jgi:hypothetical protein
MNIIEKVVHEQADENLLLQSGTFILLVIEKIFGMNVNLQLYINLLRMLFKENPLENLCNLK